MSMFGFEWSFRDPQNLNLSKFHFGLFLIEGEVDFWLISHYPENILSERTSYRFGPSTSLGVWLPEDAGEFRGPTVCDCFVTVITPLSGRVHKFFASYWIF